MSKFDYDKNYLKALSGASNARDFSRMILTQALASLSGHGKGLECNLESVLAQISRMNIDLSKFQQKFQRIRTREAENLNSCDSRTFLRPLQGLKAVLEEHLQVKTSTLYSEPGLIAAHNRLSSGWSRCERELEASMADRWSKLSSFDEFPSTFVWEDIADVLNLLLRALAQEEQVLNLKNSKARHFDRVLASLQTLQRPEGTLDKLVRIDAKCATLREAYETVKLVVEDSRRTGDGNKKAEDEMKNIEVTLHKNYRQAEAIEDELLANAWHNFVEFQVIFSQMIERNFPRNAGCKRESLATKKEQNIVSYEVFHSNQRRQFVRQLHFFSLIAHPLVETLLSYDFSMSKGLGLLQLKDPTSQNLFLWLELNPSISNRWRVLFQILLGIVHLHSMKIVHCLINPQNILMSEFSEASSPRISNFSCSLKADDPFLSSFVGADLADAGLDDFVAPELKSAHFSQKPSYAADVFSFGRLLQFLLPLATLPLSEALEGILDVQPDRRPPAVLLAQHAMWSQHGSTGDEVSSTGADQERVLQHQERALLDEERKRVRMEEESLRSFYEYVSKEFQKLEGKETQLNLMQIEVEEANKRLDETLKSLDRSKRDLHAKHQMVEDVLDLHFAQEKDLENQRKLVNEERQGAARIMQLYRHPSYWTCSLTSTHSQLVDVTDEMRGLIQDLLRDTSVVDPAVTGLRGGRALPTTYQIRQIQRVENPRMWKLYAMKRASMADVGAACRPVAVQSMKQWMRVMMQPQEGVNEVLLFHGTSQQKCSIITEQGFDERVSRAGNFGTGIYFAENCTKSLEYSRKSSKFLFLARVLLGNPSFLQQANQELRRPPKSSSTLQHDSVIGTPSRSAEFREFVTYDRTQTYPEFLIHIIT
eukprot:765981-Hanusia_phi.AAC.1